MTGPNGDASGASLTDLNKLLASLTNGGDKALAAAGAAEEDNTDLKEQADAVSPEQKLKEQILAQSKAIAD